MDMNRFTEKAQEALAGAQRLAMRFGQQQVDVDHLLLAVLNAHVCFMLRLVLAPDPWKRETAQRREGFWRVQGN